MAAVPHDVHGPGVEARADHRLRDLLIELLLLFSVGYNFLLAIVNAQLFTVTPAMTYAAELLIYAGCFGIGIWTLQREKIAAVLVGIGLIAVVMLFRYVLEWRVDAKFIRDAIIPFAFLVLGAAYGGSLPRLFLRMSVIVALVAAVELTLPDVYGNVVNPKSYYVNTRGVDEGGFWNQDSNLFVSATRPGERNFLAGSNLPRASSIFVEPVTTGNYLIFFCAILLTFWRSFSPKKIAFSIGLLLFLIVASDGRLAAGTSVLMLMGAPFLRRLDQRLSFLIMPLVIVAAAALIWVTRVDAYEDTTLGRVFLTINALRNMTAEAWLGLDFDAPYRYFDSGIAYFIASQSIMVVGAFLLAFSFGLEMPTEDGQAFKNFFMLAFATGLLVSNSLFSVKSAALWWFVLGAMWQLPKGFWLSQPGVGGHPAGQLAEARDRPLAGTS
ncbi:polysaccharide biosynthesis protein GumE [Pseudoxanthomonas sp.]|uniref:polysaccharide biosynthesis protein GumE n=1 Tax=Pseudoxanthomonas sp. TaxID=1871049 RepID=UPI00261C7622|nr:polysaccharide biosynthesis protein GumE [Pseudoxanthomonas sp.]WDS36303.1 MAG: polysaccharide biosynthesis protein GumE [Pseudoxanthomonas sp.]